MLLDAAVPTTTTPHPHRAPTFDRAVRVLWPLTAIVAFGAWAYIAHYRTPTKLDWWGVKFVDHLGLRDRPSNGAASDIRSLGSPAVVFLSFAVIAFVASTRRLLAPALVLCSAGAAACIINDAVLQKHATRVVGWPLIWNGVDHFPSGHAVGASAVAFTLIALSRVAGVRGRSFAAITIAGVSVAALVAWANVATYSHMPTSAAAGPLVSFAAVGAAYDLVGRRLARPSRAA